MIIFICGEVSRESVFMCGAPRRSGSAGRMASSPIGGVLREQLFNSQLGGAGGYGWPRRLSHNDGVAL